MKSKLAITSVILGLISFIAITTLGDVNLGSAITYLMFFSGPAGFIFGIISIFIIRIKKLEGIWLSILGILLSAIGIFKMIQFGLGVGGALGFA